MIDKEPSSTSVAVPRSVGYNVGMKRKSIALAFFSLLLFGCGNPQETVEEIPETKLTLSAGFVFNYRLDPEGGFLAELLFDGDSVSLPERIDTDGPLVAGDQVVITFEGDYEIFCVDVYPGQCRVNGKVKRQDFVKTEILGIQVADATIGDIADDIKSDYHLDNTYVILDEEGKFTPLENYEGHELYLSVNRRSTEYHCTCQDGAECEPCLTYIAGLYAYNPRPNEEA